MRNQRDIFLLQLLNHFFMIQSFDLIGYSLVAFVYLHERVYCAELTVRPT